MSFPKMTTLLALAAIATLPILADGCNRTRAASASPDAEAVLMSADGNKAGTATLEKTEAGVVLTVAVEGLTPGEHALHVHETGSCDVSDGFKSAGGHFNPSGSGHGMADANVDGVHAGDMVNLVVDEKGRATARRVLPDVSLDEGADAGSRSLLRDGGTAVVIHSGPDDYHSDPAGDAGSRIACGVIKPAGETERS